MLPTWIGVGLLWLLHWLPLVLLAALGNAAGRILAAVPSKRRCIVETNLRLCFPETPEATRREWVRKSFCTASRATLEHSILWWGSATRVRRLVHVENPELAYGDSMRPVIWLAPHFVGMDMGGIRLSLEHTIANLYAEARNPAINKIILQGRSRFSSPVLIEKRSGVKPVLSALKAGFPLHYSPDQDHGRVNSIFAPFFGLPAATVSALPRLAKLAHAQIVPLVTRQLPAGQGYRVRFYPAWDNFPSDDLDADIARMNAFIEDRVREMPEQYLWLHRRFKTRPPGEASLYTGC